MDYDIQQLIKKHKQCLDDIAEHFKNYFSQNDYLTAPNRKIKIHNISTHEDLENKKVLKGSGFYLIATNFPVGNNPCTLCINDELPVIYRGHSSNVRERLESHLFYDSYTSKDAGRRFTVCLKLDGNNINLDIPPYNNYRWAVVTHSMYKSKILIREAAEIAFDKQFRQPVGSDK